jgi:hypothetical protein
LVLLIGGLEIVRHHFGVIGGIVGSFLSVTGVQILLWLAGIRTELLGTSGDGDLTRPYVRYVDEREEQQAKLDERFRIEYTRRMSLLEMERTRLQIESEIAELEGKLAQRRAQSSQNRG